MVTHCSLEPRTFFCNFDAECLAGRFCVDNVCSDQPAESAGGEGGAGADSASGGGDAAVSGAASTDGGHAGMSTPSGGTPGSGDSGAGGGEDGGKGAGNAGAGSEAGAPDCGGYMVEMPSGRCIDWREIQRIEYHDFVLANPLPPAVPGCEDNETLEPGCEWPDFDAALAAIAVGSDDYDFWAVNRPASCVDWCDAAAYCARIDQHLCGGPFGSDAPFDDFADPTESLWSLACTQDGATDYPYGDAYVAGKCVDETTNRATQPEGTDRTTSCYGASSVYSCIKDLSGNVAEWENACDGAGGDARCRVRGGSYLDTGADVSCAASATRARLDNTDPGVGFRCCKAQCG
jgi:hypothetical protein